MSTEQQENTTQSKYGRVMFKYLEGLEQYIDHARSGIPSGSEYIAANFNFDPDTTRFDNISIHKQGQQDETIGFSISLRYLEGKELLLREVWEGYALMGQPNPVSLVFTLVFFFSKDGTLGSSFARRTGKPENFPDREVDDRFTMDDLYSYPQNFSEVIREAVRLLVEQGTNRGHFLPATPSFEEEWARLWTEKSENVGENRREL